MFSSGEQKNTLPQKKIPVHFVHKLPTPYNDFFFQMLSLDERIVLKVYHLWQGSWRRPWKTKFGEGYPNQYMRLNFGIDWRIIKTAWQDTDSLFIIADWGHLSTLALVFVRFLRKAPVALWADTPQEDAPRSLIKKSLRQWFLRSFLPHYDVIFGTGQKALRVLSEMGAKPSQLVNLPCFVALEHAGDVLAEPETIRLAKELRDKTGCLQSGVVFTMIGTLMGIKAQGIGIQAFAKCKLKTQQPVGLLIAGDGPDRSDLERLVESLSLKNNVTFLGWQEPDHMDAVYIASDVIIHPAYQDPFPLVILESMAWSKVIIGSDACGSIEDRVDHGVNGFSFPAGDVDALAQIMLDMAENPGKLALIGKSARKTAEEWPVSRGVEIIVKQASLLLGQANR